MAENDDIRSELNDASQKLNSAAKNLESAGNKFNKTISRMSQSMRDTGKNQTRLLTELVNKVTGNGGNGGNGKEDGDPHLGALEDLNRSIDALQTATEERTGVEATKEESYAPVLKLTTQLERTVAVMFRSRDQEQKHLDAIRADILTAKRSELTPADFDEWSKNAEAQVEHEREIRKDFQELRRDQDRVFLKKWGGLITVPLNKFAQYLTTIFTRSFQLQDASLKFNRTFNKTMKDAGGIMRDIPGGLATKLDSLFAFQAEGLGQVGKTSLSLATRMKITGQNMGALISVEKKLITMGSLSLKQTEALAQTILSNSSSREVAIDRLVAGLNQLDKSLATFSLAGVTGQLSTAITELGAAFPGQTEMIGKFVDMLATADISQVAILGGMKDMEAVLSGMVGDGDQLRAVISRLSGGSKRFTKDFRGMSVAAKKAMQSIVGDLGFLAQRLESNFNSFVQTARGSTDRIFTSFSTAVDDALFPFEDALTRAVTNLAAFGGSLAAFSKKMDTFAGGFLSIGRLLPALLIAGGLRRLSPRTTRIAARTGANWFGIAFAKFGKLFSKGLFSGLLRIGSKFLGPIGVALTALEVISWFAGKSSKSARTTADLTAELVMIERNKAREEFGRSKFERLTLQLLHDSILSRTLQEAFMSKGVSEMVSRLASIDDKTGVATEEIPVPVR